MQIVSVMAAHPPSASYERVGYPSPMEMRSRQTEIALADLNDSRQFGRIPFRIPVRATIFPTYEGSGEDAKVCHVLANDLSDGGISILCGRQVRQGQRLQLELPLRTQLAIACRVVPVEGGRYLVGCQFEDVSTANENETILNY